MKGKKTKKMMKTMKKADAVRALLAVLALLLLSGCTLMMDEEEPSTPDTPATGDGITAPRRVVSELGELTYQVAPGTRVLTNALRPYVRSVGTDSAGSAAAVLLSGGVPADLMPQRGDYVVTEDLLDLFEKGLCHRVGLVSPAEGGYRVSLSKASAADAYKTLDLVTDFDIVRRPAPQKAYGLWSSQDDEPEYVYDLRGTYLNPLAPYAAPMLAADGDGDEEKDWSLEFADLSVSLKNGHYGALWRKYVRHDHFWDFDPLGGKDPFNFSLGGDLDFYVGLGLALHVHSEASKEREHSEFWIALECEPRLGVAGKSTEATMTFPLMGDTSWKLHQWKTKNPQYAHIFDSYKELAKSDYWLSFNYPKLHFLLGVVPCAVGFNFNAAIDLFAALELEKPVALEAGMRAKGFRIGYVADRGQTTCFPNTGDMFTNVSPKLFTSNLTDNRFKTVGAGVRVNALVGGAFYAGEIVEAKLSATPSFSSELIWDRSTPSHLPSYFTPPTEHDGQAVGYAAASRWHNELSVGASLGADLDFRVFGVPLLNLNTPRWVPWERDKKWDPQLYVESVYPVAEKSTADSVCYVATVRCKDDDYLGSPTALPELYVVPMYGKQGRWLRCRNGGGKFDPAQAYEYEFRLPQVSTDYDYYAAPVLEGKYYDPEKFDRHATRIRFDRAEPMEVKGKGGCLYDWEEARAVAVSLGGRFMDHARRMQLQAEVYDDAGGKTTRAFDLDPPQFGASYSKKLLFIMAYTSVRPVRVSLQLWYYDKDYKPHLLTLESVEFSDYDFAPSVLDLDDMGSWRKQGYELLQ